ncbi:MAG: hypothetical protein NWR72_01450 [Bacteroidia bacterium]|nr:hypothetical protein [Bacteroidia bacterium]
MKVTKRNILLLQGLSILFMSAVLPHCDQASRLKVPGQDLIAEITYEGEEAAGFVFSYDKEGNLLTREGNEPGGPPILEEFGIGVFNRRANRWLPWDQGGTYLAFSSGISYFDNGSVRDVYKDYPRSGELYTSWTTNAPSEGIFPDSLIYFDWDGFRARFFWNEADNQLFISYIYAPPSLSDPWIRENDTTYLFTFDDKLNPLAGKMMIDDMHAFVQYHAPGNILSIETHWPDTNFTNTWEYRYDAQGRPVEVRYVKDGREVQENWSYVED